MSYNKPWWLDLFLKVMFVEAVFVGVVMGWSWIASDFDAVSLSNRFFMCGMVAGILSAFSIYGNKSYLGNFSVTYAQSVSDMNMAERTNRMMKNMYRGYRFSVIMFLSGALAILMAVLIA